MEYKENNDVPWEKSHGTKSKRSQYHGQINKTMQLRKKMSTEVEQLEQTTPTEVLFDEKVNHGWKESDFVFEKEENSSFTYQTDENVREYNSATRRRSRRKENLKPITKPETKISTSAQGTLNGTNFSSDDFILPYGWTESERVFDKGEKHLNSFETENANVKYTTGRNRGREVRRNTRRSIRKNTWENDKENRKQNSQYKESSHKYQENQNRFDSKVRRRGLSRRSGVKITAGIVVPTNPVLKISKAAIKKARQKVTEALQRQKKENRKNVKTGALVMSIPFLPLIAVGFFLMSFLTLIPTIILAILISTAAPPDIVAVAQMECGAWESNIGGEKYKTWYGIDGNWCAMFVSYCADQCGYIADGIMPRTASVMEMSNWYREQERFYYAAEGYVPKAGDIIFFQEGMSHVGIVVGYDDPTKTVVVIEGNTGSSNTEIYHEGSMVALKSYPLTYIRITGYGVPKYPNTLLMKAIETENVLCGGELKKCA